VREEGGRRDWKRQVWVGGWGRESEREQANEKAKKRKRAKEREERESERARDSARARERARDNIVPGDAKVALSWMPSTSNTVTSAQNPSRSLPRLRIAGQYDSRRCAGMLVILASARVRSSTPYVQCNKSVLVLMEGKDVRSSTPCKSNRTASTTTRAPSAPRVTACTVLHCTQVYM
jgi:hypothetical protein